MSVIDSGWFELDGNDQRGFAYVTLEHAQSRMDNGRRFMEIQESSSSQIDTVVEAVALAESALTDLAENDLNDAVDVDLNPEVTIQDLTVLKGGILFTANQRLATRTVRHSVNAQGGSTSIVMRGKPSIGITRWLEIETRVGMGRPPTFNPAISLVDQTKGQLIRYVTGLLDLTDYFTGGKYLSIRNGDFRRFTRGLGSPPDSWSVGAGVWNTDLLAEKTLTRVGGTSLRLVNGTGQLVSDLVPVDGGDITVPFSFEMLWQRTAVSTKVPALIVDWVAGDRTTIVGTTTLGPGLVGVPQMPAPSSTAAGQWFTSRVDGIQSPLATARYMKMTLAQSGAGGATPLIIDSVTAYRTSRATRLGQHTPAPAAWGLAVAGQTKNQPFGPTVAIGTTYDRGSQWVDDHASASPNNGYHFLCRENGTHEVVVDAWVLGSLVGAKDYTWQLVKNGGYTITTSARTAGTVIASQRQTRTFTLAPPGSDRIIHELELVEGDRLTVDILFTSGPGTLRLATGLIGQPSIWSVKLRGLD